MGQFRCQSKRHELSLKRVPYVVVSECSYNPLLRSCDYCVVRHWLLIGVLCFSKSESHVEASRKSDLVSQNFVISPPWQEASSRDLFRSLSNDAKFDFNSHNVSIEMLDVHFQPIRDWEDTILLYKAHAPLTLVSVSLDAPCAYSWLRCCILSPPY